jgi:4-amino-4-deoxy-L-arabinose transferase-like glycosyltransferase
MRGIMERTSPLGYILLLCLCLRLGFFAISHPWDYTPAEQVMPWDRNATEYQQMATTLLHTHNLMEPGRFSDAPHDVPAALRTPLYPVFVAGIYALFGIRPWIVFLVQIALDVASCLFLVRALDRALGRRVALTAGTLYAIDPFLIMYCSRLLSEIPFICIMSLGVFAISVALTARSSREALIAYGCAGLLFGVDSMVKPVSQYIVAVAVIVIIYSLWRRPLLAVAGAALVSCAFIFGASPWLVRNYLTYSRVALSTSGPYNALMQYTLPMEVARRRLGEQTVKAQLQSEVNALIRADGTQPVHLNSFQRADYQQQLALTYIRRYPTNFLKSYIVGVKDFFTDLRTSEFSRVLKLQQSEFSNTGSSGLLSKVNRYLSTNGPGGLAILLLVGADVLVTYATALLGLFTGWSRPNRAFLLFCLLSVLYFVIAAGPSGTTRLRLPAVEFYLPFAALGMLQLADTSLPRLAVATILSGKRLRQVR